MFSNEVVACRMEQNWEAPRISKGDQMRFAWKEINIEDSELSDLFPGHSRFIQAYTQLRVEH